MEEVCRDGEFSPRATVENIQRRLLRPSSLHSPPPLFSRGCNSSRSEANFTRFCRKREGKEGESEKRKKNKKLEDYLDPVLLSAISSKISRANEIPKVIVKREVEDFAWPVDELKMLTEVSAIRNENNVAVNLGNNSDDHLNDDIEEGDDKFSTPFRKFEQTRFRLFGF